MTLHFADARPPCRVRFLIDAGGIRSATRRQLLGDAPIPRLRVGRVKVTAWQCPSSAPAPPQGEAAALGGSRGLCGPRTRPAYRAPATASTARASRLQSRRSRRSRRL